MIKMKFSKFMKQKYNTRGEWHELYVLKGEARVLYIGISKVNIWWRWFGAPSSHLYWDADDKLCFSSSVGKAVVKCSPDSMNWMIELWTAEDCIKFLRPEIKDQAEENHCRRDIHFAESLMIKKLKPVLNIAGSAFRYDALPEKIKRYVLEDEEKAFRLYYQMFDSK